MKTSLHALLASPNQQNRFIGFMTNSILGAVATGIEEVISVKPEMAHRHRYVFGIYVEMLQNTLFHSNERTNIASGGDAAYGGIEIALEENLVSISAVNLISAKQFPA